jgi:hypothetical protein
VLASIADIILSSIALAGRDEAAGESAHFEVLLAEGYGIWCFAVK